MFDTNNSTKKYFQLSIAAHFISATLILFLSTDLKLKSKDLSNIDFIISDSRTLAVDKVQKIQKIRKSASTDSSPFANYPESANSSTQNINSAAEQKSANTALGQVAVTAEQIYMAELKQFLDSQKKYPPMAKKMGHTGRVLVQFELNSNGQVTSKKIITPSDHQSLNNSTLHMIDRMGQFKKFPDQIKKTSWKFVLPVDYKL